MFTYARGDNEISKQLFPRVSSRGLKEVYRNFAKDLVIIIEAILVIFVSFVV